MSIAFLIVLCLFLLFLQAFKLDKWELKEQIKKYDKFKLANVLILSSVIGLLFAFLVTELELFIYFSNRYDLFESVLRFGVNISLIALVCWLLFVYIKKWTKTSKLTTILLIGLLMIALSLSIYENPFLKIINLIVLPLVTIFVLLPVDKFWTEIFSKGFTNYMKHRPSIFWTLSSGKIVFLAGLSKKGDKIKNIIIGIVGLIVIWWLVVVPLLMMSDSIFSNYIEDIFWFFHFDNLRTVIKNVLWFILISLFVAWLFAYLIYKQPVTKDLKEEPKKTQTNTEKDENSWLFNTISLKIILWWLVLIYWFYIFVQFEHIFAKRFLDVFATAESAVKSGFFQLLVISVINLLFIWFIKAKKTVKVKSFLVTFSVLSLLLCVSNLYRVFLYNQYYGLSYEKFFALYTCLFMVILFAILIYKEIRNNNIKVVNLWFILVFCMYSFVTILPVEKIIFHSNMQLSKLENSKINLSELTVLSSDVYNDVKANLHNLVVDSYSQNERVERWHQRDNVIRMKARYQKNLFNVLANTKTKYDTIDITLSS